MKTAIAELLRWSDPRHVSTKRGERILRTAAPDSKFWGVWKSHKAELKDLGISCSKNKDGNWEICWWQTPTIDTERIDSSRATDSTIEIPVPDGLEYLPYQRAGIEYALTQRNCLIADEMGLGKTIQAIGVLNSRPAEKTILILCPASLKLNWQREVEKWDTNQRESQIVTNGKWRGNLAGKVTICNFELAAKLLPQMANVTFDRVIVDESHRLKNSKAKSTRAVYGYWDRHRRQPVPGIPATSWTLLTGTPILNRPVELWTALRKLDPDGLGRSFSRFATRYCAARRTRFGLDTSGASNLDELQTRMRERIMVRRLKRDVLSELPPKLRQVIPLATNGNRELVAEERELLTQRDDRIRELVAARELAKANDTPDEYQRTIEAMREELGILFSEMARVRHDLAVSKLPAVIDHLHDAVSNENPVIVFCWHKDVIDGLREQFPEAGVIDGRTSQRARQEAVDDFQAGRTNLLIGNIRAAGVGLTLTASSHVVFAELDWTPANLSQAEDRAHRIGQQNSVLVQHLVVDGSLDAEMAARCIAKQAVADQALDLMASQEPETPIDEPATIDIDWDAVTAQSQDLDPEIIDTVHVGLRILAHMCDGAVEKDGVGFNGVDTRIGKSLARAENLTARQAVLGRKILLKYHRQLPGDINDGIRIHTAVH